MVLDRNYSSPNGLYLEFPPWRRIWDRKEIIKAVRGRAEAVEEEETTKNTIKIRPTPPRIL